MKTKTDTVSIVKPAIMTVVLLCLMVPIAHLSCSGTAPTAYDKDGIVIQANLYAGQAVDDIRLSWMSKRLYDTSFTYQYYVIDSTTSPPDTIQKDTVITHPKYGFVTLDNAQVSISSEGHSWPLLYSGTDGWYNEPTKSLVITAGKTYRLDVIAEGRHAWAETTVPSTVTGLQKLRDFIHASGSNSTFTGTGIGTSTSTNKSTITTSTKKIAFSGTSGATTTTWDVIQSLTDSTTSLTLKWDNPDNKYVFYTCELDSPAGLTYRGRSYLNGDSIILTTRNISIGSSSGTETETGTGTATYVIPKFTTLRYSGRYKFTLLKPTDDLWKIFYERADTTSLIQDYYTRSFSNVNDGVGFLASFSKDSIFVNVVENEQ